MKRRKKVFIILISLFTSVLLFSGVSYLSGIRDRCMNTPVIADFENASEWALGNTSPNLDKDKSGTKIVDGGPEGLFIPDKNKKQKILGIKLAFTSKGYNFAEVLPPVYTEDLYPNIKDLFTSAIPKDNERFIPLPGKIHSIDLWVAGRNYRYTLEIWIQDFNGFIYPLEMGNVNYAGWKNLSRSFPAYIPQEENYIPKEKPLKFVKYVLRADPHERADRFYIYLDHMKVITDLHVVRYDGIDNINDNW